MINIEGQFEKIYHEYYPVLLRFVGSKRLKQINTEEIAQEALARLWEKRDECNFDNDAQLAAWLIRTSRFVILEYTRIGKDTECLTDHENTVSDTNHIEQRIEDIRLKQYLHEIEQDLSEYEQLIFKMVFIEHRPYRECAAELKIKDVSLRSSISRLRKKLKPYVDRILEEEK